MESLVKELMEQNKKLMEALATANRATEEKGGNRSKLQREPKKGGSVRIVERRYIIGSLLVLNWKKIEMSSQQGGSW